MALTSFKCERCNVERATSASDLCEICSPAHHTNDNDQPTQTPIAFSDLALALQVDEDVLLQRLAAILCKRDEVADSSDETAE